MQCRVCTSKRSTGRLNYGCPWLFPQLGKAKGGRDFLESLKAEGESVEDVPHPAAAAAGAQRWLRFLGGTRLPIGWRE